MDSLNKIIIITLFALGTTGVRAQQLTGVAGMVNTGFVSTKGFPSPIENLYTDSIRFPGGYTLIGTEGYYRNGKAIMSLSGYLGLQGARPHNGNLLERSLWTTSAGLGWIIYGDPKFSLYPSIGLGITGLSLTEYKNHPRTQTSRVQEIIPSVDFSLHLDYIMMNSSHDDRIVDGIVLGIKTGYNYGASSTTPFQGWYATVSIGGLAFMTKKQ